MDGEGRGVEAGKDPLLYDIQSLAQTTFRDPHVNLESKKKNHHFTQASRS